jgi:hypothetical protein
VCVCRREGGREREVRSNKVSCSWRKFALLLLLCPVEREGRLPAQVSFAAAGARTVP